MSASRSAIANVNRALALRLYARDPRAIQQVKAKVKAALLRGASSKEAGFEAGISPSAACRWARSLGFRQMYLTDRERKGVLRRRRA